MVQVDATSFDVLIDRTEVGSGWATEVAAQAETATPTIERISIKLHELSAMPKASQRLLDDSAFDVEGWLAGKIATRFIRAEAAAFINGDGVDKPKGIPAAGQGGECVLDLGQSGLYPDRRGGGFRRQQRQRLHREPGLCAGRRLPRQWHVRHELEDRRRGAQDEGCRWSLHVVGQPAGRRACAPDGLSRC